MTIVNQHQQESWNFSTVLYEDIVNTIGKTSLNLPSTFMSTTTITSSIRFNEWKQSIIEKFGDEGILEFDGYFNIKIKDNKNWDDYCLDGTNAVLKFYSNSGAYTGD